MRCEFLIYRFSRHRIAKRVLISLKFIGNFLKELNIFFLSNSEFRTQFLMIGKCLNLRKRHDFVHLYLRIKKI
jgi:hypothetical protein